MNLRWSSYVAPKPPKWAQKRKMAVFHPNSHFAWRKSATQFVCVKTVNDKVARQSWPNYPCKNDWWVTSSSTWNFGSNWPRWSEIADVRFLFARSASALTPSEKSSINTNRKSTISNEPNYGLLRRSRSFKVTDVGTKKGRMRLLISNFLISNLLVITNLHLISYRFQVIADCCSFFGQKTPLCVFEPPWASSFRLIGKLVLDFLFVLTELSR